MNRTAFGVAAALATLSVLAGPVAAHGPGKEIFRDRDGWSTDLFDFFDGNGDEVVTMDEIRATRDERFSDADVDGDGKLSADELISAIGAWHAERQAHRIANRIEQLDSDGDGLLSLDEVTAITELGRFERLFEHLDADGDGAITKSEMDNRGDGHRHRSGKGRGH